LGFVQTYFLPTRPNSTRRDNLLSFQIIGSIFCIFFLIRADFFLLHRQTHVLFYPGSSGPLAVVKAGAQAAPAKANMNILIDPLERASKQALQRCRLQQLYLLLLQQARRRWPGRRAGGNTDYNTCKYSEQYFTVL
jgi:hypothetical protein